MQSCKANCGGAAKLSEEHAKQIADVLCGMAAKERASLSTSMPARLKETREALTHELRLLAEVTYEPARKGKRNKPR